MHKECEKGHGRVETRSLQVSTALQDYISFPHAHQVFRLTRERIHCKTKKRETEVVYGITSLTPEEASPSYLLHLNRSHWSIENRSHYVRDMAYDEDRQQVRTKNGPRIMASFRNFAISLLRLAGFRNITAALRQMAAHRQWAFGLLGLVPLRL